MILLLPYYSQCAADQKLALKISFHSVSIINIENIPFAVIISMSLALKLGPDLLVFILYSLLTLILRLDTLLV